VAAICTKATKFDIFNPLNGAKDYDSQEKEDMASLLREATRMRLAERQR
jgi:hypothetical protein